MLAKARVSDASAPPPPSRPSSMNMGVSMLILMSLVANLLLIVLLVRTNEQQGGLNSIMAGAELDRLSLAKLGLQLDALDQANRLERCQVVRALLVIDVQDCFLERGTLPVPDASRIIPVLNDITANKSHFFHTVVRTQDFHDPSHISFAGTLHLPPFYNSAGGGISVACTHAPSAGCCPILSDCPTSASSCLQASEITQPSSNPSCAACFPNGQNATMNQSCAVLPQSVWPAHCIDPALGGDANFPTALLRSPDDIILRKGTNKYIEAYSAFFDNGHYIQSSLHQTLRERGVTEVYVAGLATDFCVSYSAFDSVTLGYKTFVIEDAVAGIGIPLGAHEPNKTTVHLEKERLLKAGVRLIHSDLLPSDEQYLC